MRSAIYRDRLKAEVIEVPVPEVGPADVLVKTVRSSICGSDVNGVGVWDDCKFGHETAGYVAEVGARVTEFAEGDRVWVNPINSMPNNYESCMLGGFTDYVLIPEARLDYSLYRLPESVSWDEASLIEPFGVGTRGKNRPGAKPGDHVVVYGAGSIGLFCISALTAQGIVPVVVDIALSDYKRALLEKMGAVIAPLEGDRTPFLREHFGMVPQHQIGMAVDVDIVVDCAGAPTVVADFFKLLKENSRLSLVGVNVPQVLNTRMMMSSEVVVMGSSGYDHNDICEVIDNLANKRTFVSEIITHHFPLEDINEALHTAADREKAIKVVIDME